MYYSHIHLSVFQTWCCFIQERGMLLVAPEQRLSLKLKHQEIQSRGHAWELELRSALDAVSNNVYVDVLDESDELLHHRWDAFSYCCCHFLTLSPDFEVWAESTCKEAHKGKVLQHATFGKWIHNFSVVRDCVFSNLHVWTCFALSSITVYSALIWKLIGISIREFKNDDRNKTHFWCQDLHSDQ